MPNSPFTRLSVENHDGVRRLVRWDTSSDAKIYRSAQYGGDYTEIASLTGATQHIDKPTTRPTPRDEYFYRVDLISGGAVTETLGPKGPEDPPDTGTLHVRRQIRRHLRRVGEASVLFEKAGLDQERCPECWDDVREVQRRSECDNCGGSGYVSGWPDGIEMPISYSSGDPAPQDTQGGEVDTMQMKAFGAAIPAISIGDHLVRRRDREVFRVVRQEKTRRSGHRLRQNVIIKLIERGASARSLASEVDP